MNIVYFDNLLQPLNKSICNAQDKKDITKNTEKSKKSKKSKTKDKNTEDTLERKICTFRSAFFRTFRGVHFFI